MGKLSEAVKGWRTRHDRKQQERAEDIVESRGEAQASRDHSEHIAEQFGPPNDRV